MVKFADDSAVPSLLQGTQDGHDAALDDFTEWCDESYFDLNVNKTKEMMVDFRRQGRTYWAIQINGESMGIVHSYKYLGTIFGIRGIYLFSAVMYNLHDIKMFIQYVFFIKLPSIIMLLMLL